MRCTTHVGVDLERKILRVPRFAYTGEGNKKSSKRRIRAVLRCPVEGCPVVCSAEEEVTASQNPFAVRVREKYETIHPEAVA